MKFKDIIQTFEDGGFSPTRYSGREMGGEYCVGIQVNENPFDTILDIVIQFADSKLAGSGGDIEFHLLDDCLELLKGAKTDSLGKGAILYFPNLKWEDEKEFDD